MLSDVLFFSVGIWRILPLCTLACFGLHRTLKNNCSQAINTKLLLTGFIQGKKNAIQLYLKVATFHSSDSPSVF